MGVHFFIVEALTANRAEFFPISDVLTYCLPVGATRRHWQSPMQYLDSLAQEAGVRPLSEFISSKAQSYFGEGETTTRADGLPTSQWFTASEGLVTIRGLLGFVTTHTELAADVKRVTSELRQFECVVLDLQQKGVRWHLEDGSWW
jgi:hypothetical protein